MAGGMTSSIKVRICQALSAVLIVISFMHLHRNRQTIIYKPLVTPIPHTQCSANCTAPQMLPTLGLRGDMVIHKSQESPPHITARTITSSDGEHATLHSDTHQQKIQDAPPHIATTAITNSGGEYATLQSDMSQQKIQDAPPHIAGSTILTSDGEHATLSAKRSYIAVREDWLCGLWRLGNKMSMIAAAVAAAATAERASFAFINEPGCKWLGNLRQLFIGLETAPLISSAERKEWLNLGQEEKDFNIFSKINVTTNMTITGYRQHIQYFAESSKQKLAVRRAFTIRGSYAQAALRELELAQKASHAANVTFIGVHVRLGDLKQQHFINYGFQTAGAEFYAQAFRVMTFKYGSDTVFVVASDSLDSAKEMLGSLTSKFRIYYSSRDEFTDFAMLSRCNHSIISGGTYGFWAAWLSGGDVIYHKGFARPGSDFAKGYCVECFFLPSWMPL